MTSELGQAVWRIGWGMATRFRRSAREDLAQQTVLLVAQILPRLDPDRSLFSYISQIAKTATYSSHRNNQAEKRKVQSYIRANKPDRRRGGYDPDQKGRIYDTHNPWT